MKRKNALNVRKLAIIGVLGAISTVLGMTPLGFIPVGPTRATIMHIPVIIGAIMEGPIVGGFVGLIFGLFSIFQAITNPTPVSFAFLNPLVSILPRVLIGIFSFYAYDFLRKIGDKKTKWILYILWISIVGYLTYGIYGNIVNDDSKLTLLMNAGLLVLTVMLAYFTLIRFKNASLDIIIPSIIINIGIIYIIIFIILSCVSVAVYLVTSACFLIVIGSSISALYCIVFNIKSLLSNKATAGA